MADKKEVESKDIKYNKKGREALFRVEITTADSPEAAEKMRKMTPALIAKSGTAKKGFIDLFEWAEKQGYFDK
tara:strand:- start:2984 stop:3202 length:219 start_codon:yes stop_codon:yes gene_type:complete